jgi:hypothetical protein
VSVVDAIAQQSMASLLSLTRECLLTVYFEGEGLVQVFRRASIEGEDVSVQFSIYGEALAILTLEGERERLFYERDMGYGKRETAEEIAQEVLRELEPTITEDEAMAYYL